MPPDHVIKAQNRALELNHAHQNGGPIQTPTTPQTTLNQLLNDPDATWNFSTSGGGGASIVRSTSATGGGAAIKIEHDQMIHNAERSGKFLEEFYKRANGTPPFTAPRVRTYKQDFFTQNVGLKDELDRRLDAEKTPTLNSPDRVDNHKQGLQSIMTNDDHAVFVMEFGNGKPLSSLPVEEKAALLRSSAFAESIGRAFAPCVVLGLRDHLGEPANPSNVLYDSSTGEISVIDYDPGGAMVMNGHPVVGTRNSNPETLAKMRQFLEDATESPEGFQKAIDTLMDAEKGTPFHQVFTSMYQTGSEHGEVMFKRTDDATLRTDISVTDKRDFAAHFLKGAIDGMAYLQTNRQALKDATLSTHEDMPDGTKLEHFYDQAKLDRLDEEIGKFDIAKLQNGMNQVMQHREQHLGEEHDALRAKELRMKELNLAIDRRVKHPTAWEKVKDFFGRSNAVNRMQQERDPLARQLHLENQNYPDRRRPVILDDKADWIEFHQKTTGNQVNAPQNQNVGPQQTVGNTTGRTQLTTARGPSLQPPQTPPITGRPQLTTARGPGQQPNDTPTPNVSSPPPERPLPQPPGDNVPTTDQHPPKVSDLIKGFEKSPPPDNLRNRTGERAKPRVRDTTQTNEGTSQEQGHGTGHKPL